MLQSIMHLTSLFCKFLCFHGGVSNDSVLNMALGNQILMFQDKFAMKLQADAGNSLSDLIQQSFPSIHGIKIHIR